MPALWIGWNDGAYSLFILNTDISYPFLGGTVQEQFANAQRLARAMASGADTLEAEVYGILDVDKENFPTVADFVDSVWGETGDLVYDMEIAYEAAEGVSLLDVLADAGAALVAVMG